MKLRVLALLAGMICLVPSAWADDQDAVGRYRIIADALVPGKGGQLQKRAVLLDSLTGRTWVIAEGVDFGHLQGPLWVPIQTKSPDDRVDELAETPEAIEGLATPPKQGQKSRVRNRLERRFDHFDDNP